MPQRAFEEKERRSLQEEMFRLEDQKDQAEERYHYLFQNALVGLFQMDAHSGEVLDANKALLELFAVESLAALNTLAMENKSVGSIRNNILSSPQSHGVRFTLNMVRADQSSFWAQISARYIAHSGTIEGVINDVSQQVEARREIRHAMEDAQRARVEAEEANHAKSIFLANMSHEIRTPLNGIIGFSEIVQSTGNLKRAHGYAAKILEESERLMTLINQLLDLSKIEAHKVVLDHKDFALKHLLDDLIDPLLITMDQKGLQFDLKIGDEVSPFYKGDSFRLSQVLRNLLANAIKFTEEGSISLAITIEENQGAKDLLLFEVQDTGVGIAPEKQSAIFEQFTQADNSIERKYGGTGLGVSICQELVELMGGTLWLESQESRGSSFYFRLLMERGDDPGIGRRTGKEDELHCILKDRTILLAEDYATNREIVELHLSDFDLTLEMAETGLEALEMCQQKSYDLILMDVHMPVMNGLDAAMAIRQVSAYSDVPMIAMTASAFNEDRERCLGAGMDDFLPKPIRKRLLLELMAHWLSPADSEETSPCYETKQEKSSQEGCCDDSKGAEPEYPEYSIHELSRELEDEEIAKEVVQGFLETGWDILRSVKDGLMGGHREQAHRGFHSLKGGALNIFAEELSQKARHMELRLVEEIPEDWQEGFALVEEAFRRLEGHFKRIK